MFDVKLVKLPKKVLRQKSVNVSIPLIQEDIDLAEKMIYHIDDSQKENSKFRPGVGVAAVQYGILKNVFYVHVRDSVNNKEIFRDVLFNPKIISRSETKTALSEGEGCLSVHEDWPGQEGFVHRDARVIVEAYSYFQKKVVTFDVFGYVAIVFQHELDHLQGNLFIDRINKKQPWKKVANAIYL
ncbi:peptide deformylase [Mycoplasmopsis alligatoris]|uniref:Peptide deformylase n=1 Tax=Mycoplasmopsis alligatoris A21JP2 TaxID=747682 RepID=D4XWB8_9BACT|nr:peptide deformylase [Mycoplasmopsis alligatoris]EFF41295.1 peptide deformylase [Mycoplasmopsis alligatoris A21JP2]